jgi:hypothetical protein
MLHVPFAYKYAVIAAMLCQVNFYAPRLRLPIESPVKEQDIRFLAVADPVITAKVRSYGGRIQVGSYSFGFTPRGHVIRMLDKYGYQSLGVQMDEHESSSSGLERASLMKYIVNTNDVYQMATNWLMALDVDIKRLESVETPRSNRYPLFHSKRGWVASPLLSVEWENPKLEGHDPDAVMVEISAVTGDLLQLRDGRGLFGTRTGAIVKNIEALLAISDEDFLKFNEQQRRGLVERYVAPPDSVKDIPFSLVDKLFETSQQRKKE